MKAKNQKRKPAKKVGGQAAAKRVKTAKKPAKKPVKRAAAKKSTKKAGGQAAAKRVKTAKKPAKKAAKRATAKKSKSAKKAESSLTAPKREKAAKKPAKKAGAAVKRKKIKRGSSGHYLLYRGDCLRVIPQVECPQVDLIYLDPPFNSHRAYNFVFPGGGEGAEQVAFNDMWDGRHANQLRMQFMQMLDGMDVPQRLKEFIRLWVEVLMKGGNDDRRLLNYLLYMTQRLMEMRKVLKPTGSIYLHCDSTAGHYLKVMMDAVFGRENFRNEIVWKRYRGKRSNAKYKFSVVTDSILFYGMPEAGAVDIPHSPLDDDYVRRTYKHDDNDGKGPYRFGGRIADRKYYLQNSKGVPCTNLWDDIPELNGKAAEATGYRTQKPLALLERILQASSKEGDWVLDPFCGCGTTVDAAERLGRNWVGIDISAAAIGHIQKRLDEEHHLREGVHYMLEHCDPETMQEYNKLNPYEKQEFLVGRVGGSCGPRGGDGGVDGAICIHLGDDTKPEWGDFIISVKTGNQAQPAHIDQLRGAMQKHNAPIGGLILDRKPTSGMVHAAQTAGKMNYKTGRYSRQFNRVQILTAEQVLAGKEFDIPPTLAKKKLLLGKPVGRML